MSHCAHYPTHAYYVNLVLVALSDDTGEMRKERRDNDEAEKVWGEEDKGRKMRGWKVKGREDGERGMRR